MIEKQTTRYIDLMEISLLRMEASAIDGDYVNAIKERKNINDVLSELINYLISMGYKLEFKFSDKITSDDFDRLSDSVTTLVMNQLDPIIEFVDKLRKGGSMTTSEEIQFYTNNKEAIEKEMKK